MGCNGLQWRNFGELHPPSKKIALKGGLQVAVTVEFLENYPLIKIATHEWAAMDCNEKNFEELPLTNFE